MDNNQIAIKVHDMSKDFKRVFDKPSTLKERLVFFKRDKVQWHHVLKNINLDIKKGETVALVGTNGSGKSTLLKLMTKILYPNKGELITYGKLTSLLELGAGFHPDFTGRENIYFNASIFGLTREEIDKRVDEIIDFSELGDFIDNPIRTYSSGMYMRLAFSVAINIDVDILLIDEILSVGDQHFQEKCFAKLQELKESDKTIVIVSHSLDMIERLCTRAIWIYNGEVRQDGAPKEIIEAYLQQVIKDSAEQNSVIGSEKIEGLLVIDMPAPEEVWTKPNDTREVSGWEVSNVKDTVVKVIVDDTIEYIASRHERADVLLHHQETYGGAYMNLEPGFKAIVSVKGFVGRHIFKVIVEDVNGKQISKQEVAMNFNYE
jgi:ABC-type polysaccharide/polyol phosphate transport system ATPase subunit